MQIDTYCRCSDCGLTYRVVGPLNDALFGEFTQRLQCPRCPGPMRWSTEFQGFSQRIGPEKFFRLIKGVDSPEGRPEPESVAAMLTTFRIQQVLMDGPGIRALYLDCGIVLHLGISKQGAYVHKLTRSDNS